MSQNVVESYVSVIYPTQTGGATGFEGTISRAERGKEFFSEPPPFAYRGGHETEYCTVFVIVVMTSKCLPAANAIT